MSVASGAIGVFDSGIGGLTALRKLAELLPTENLIYLGDTARVPYGNRSEETIRLYAQQSAEFLLRQSVKFILIACNTISCVALADIEKLSPVPVMGVIKPAVTLALDNIQASSRIGIIGTRATIQSRAYELEIHNRLNPDRKIAIFTTPCPLLVPLVEEGWHQHPVTYSIAEEYLKPMITAEVDTLILGCTHYPILKTVIQEIMPKVKLIDSGESAAVKLAEQIKASSGDKAICRNERTIKCYLTDLTTNCFHFTQQYLGISQNDIHEISVER